MKDKALTVTHEERERYILLDTLNIILSVINIVFSVVTVNSEKPAQSMYLVIFVSCAAICFLNVFRLYKQRKSMAIFNAVGFVLMLVLNIYVMLKK